MKGVLAVIPARGGSKGVPRKNVRPLAGKPLIAWSIEAALRARSLAAVVVSTEDDEIASVARAWGAKVLRRPAALATDEATTLSVLEHAVEELSPEAVVVLQPTSPLRSEGLIDRCVAAFRAERADCLATGFPCKFREYGRFGNVRRQDIKGFFYDDGNVYVLSRKLIESGRWAGGRIARVETSQEENFEIDTDLDFHLAEKIMERRLEARHAPDLRRVGLLAMDVDGVLTDAGMYYSMEGEALKKFNTRDGKGIDLVHAAGIKTAILTQEKTGFAAARAKKLKIGFVRLGVKDKLSGLKEAARWAGVPLERAAYIGDDVNDTAALRAAGFSATPRNGVEENKRIASYICRTGGGEGCVREVCDLLLRSRSGAGA